MPVLPQTGTASLLETLSPFINDTHINQTLPRLRGPGRPRVFSSAQLFRVVLLSLLTPVHSFNLLVKLLPENRAWRRFARLPNLRVLPDAKMLHQFRSRLDLIRLRDINAALLRPLLDLWDATRLPLAIMDSTDLPAPVNSFKKRTKRFPPAARPWARARRRPGKAAGTSVTKNTVFVYGCRSGMKRFYWFP